MNKRILKKQLKKKIERLETKNRMLMDIIDNSPQMSDLYDRMTRPVVVQHTNVRVEKLMSQRHIVSYDDIMMYFNDPETYRDVLIDRCKRSLEESIFDKVKDCISYEIVPNGITQLVTATIYVGKADT